MAQRRVQSFALIPVFAAAFAFAPANARARADGLKVHEWGTFTSIAGADGLAAAWQPLSAAGDLPCFINHIDNNQLAKSGLTGTVRMETPVLYFYAPHTLTAAVKVRFPQGVITEWYPQAVLSPVSRDPKDGSIALRDGAIAWPEVAVSPQAAPDFPISRNASHYYAARATGAAPLRVGQEQERFLFYRGVGNFALPLWARLTEKGEAAVRNPGGARLGGIIFIEKRRDKIGYRLQAGLEAQEQISIAPPSLDGDAFALRSEIIRLLVAQGLYPAEAQAMAETWRDSWLEEGSRLLYLVPRETIDAVLPLSIEPGPAELARVFMGRMELITPATLKTVEGAIADNDPATFKRYGRFALPIVQRISAEPEHKLDQIRLGQLLTATDAGTASRAPACP
jgi:hypothetical protein